jgi:putative ABC transport system permease protein
VRRILLACTRLYPRPFRDAFATDVANQAARDVAQARARGIAPGAWTALISIFNIIGGAMAERIRPTWHAPALKTKGFDMRKFLDHWRLDTIYALRSLRRSTGFTVVAVLTLALAIGVTAGMFSVVNAVLIKPLPFTDPDRLLFVNGTSPGSDLPPEFGVSSEFYLQYRQRARLVEDVALVTSFTNTMRVNGRVERIRMAGPTYNLFSLLGVNPVLGRLPTAADEQTVAVISHALWQDWFGGRDDVIGQRHSIGGDQRTIIGVMPPEFQFPVDGTLAWITTEVREAGLVPGRFGIAMVARMKAGANGDDVAREFTNLARELPARFGGSPVYARIMAQYIALVQPLADRILGTSARPLWVLFGAAGFVLLIACANVANLFMVRADGRQREMAVRQAIGAQRTQLLRVLMAEVLLVAVAAGAVAIAFAKMTLPVFLRTAPPGLPRLATINVNLETIVFTGLIAALAGLACGLIPALRASRPGMLGLRDGSRSATRARLFARHALVAGQTALALVLLIGSGLLLRSHAKLSAVNPGYDVKDVYTFQIAPEQPSLTDGPAFAQFILGFAERLRALPGVQAVGVVENVPLDEGTATTRYRTDNAPGEEGKRLNVTFAGADYYKAMGIPVLAGRAFTREDAVSSLGNVVISRSAAHMLWPNQNAIGRKLQRDGLTTWETVVGVVEDVMQDNFREPGSALVYHSLTGLLPTQWRLSSPAYVIKSARADSIAADVRAVVRDVAPEAPMYRAYTMEQLAERSMLSLSFTMLTLGLVSSLAVILGAVGLYGVLSYVVSERTREIGVRLALGAQVSAVRRMVVAQGARVISVGIVIGLAVAAMATRALGTLLYGVDPYDVVTFGGTVGLMVVIGLAATYVPARRASNVDPIESLRGD